MARDIPWKPNTESDTQTFTARTPSRLKELFVTIKEPICQGGNSSVFVFIQQHSFKTSVDSLAVGRRLTSGEKYLPNKGEIDSFRILIPDKTSS